ncbi:unnamed protein product [Moneuplotes crassus]|uniref:Uncharacterized protein n=1 Tax=Euplotes crassus TaxID=5936 RepID=A0AAD1XFH4_EUPCR|nr:unnamed protein product [Moneuplotes crassus]
MIREMFSKNKEEEEKIRLAVVLSCHSQKVGEIFANAGVNHVVCIKRECEVADQACLTFAKAFYYYLLYGEECSVCSAFEQGKKAVLHKFKGAEANKFLCLCDHQNKVANCGTFFQLDKGESKNKSIKTKIEALPDRGRKLIGREKEIVKIIQQFENHRCVWLTGDEGIGKSSIAKEVSHLIFDRNYCRDGVLYLSLKEIEVFEDFIDILFKTMKHSLRSIKKRNELQSFVNCDPEELYHSCMYNIKDFEILIVLDNCDAFMAKDEFKNMITDLSKKIQNSKMILTSKIKENIIDGQDGRPVIFDAKEIKINELSAISIFSLIQPAKKNILTFNKEFKELCISTGHVNEKNKCLDFLKHELITLLKGNPLCALLVSSNADDKTLSEIYKKVKDYEKKKKNITLGLALQISLEFIQERSPEILKCLNHLSLCPDGLSFDNLLNISKEWNKNWIQILKDKSIIIEKKIYKEDYILKKKDNKDRKTRKPKLIKTHSIDDDVYDVVYRIEPWRRELIEENLSDKGKAKLDEKIVEFMINHMEELLKAPKELAGLLEIYEENCWAILDRLREKASKSNNISFLSTSIPKDFGKVKGKEYRRQMSKLGGKAAEAKKQPKVRKSITNRFGMQKFRLKKKPTLAELCFTGQFEERKKDTKNIYNTLTKNPNQSQGFRGNLSSSRLNDSSFKNKEFVKKITGLKMDKIDEENPSKPEVGENLIQGPRDTLQVNKKVEDAHYIESASENIGTSSGQSDDLSGKEGEVFDQSSAKEENKVTDDGFSLKFEGGSEDSEPFSDEEGEEFSSDGRDENYVISSNKIIKVNPDDESKKSEGNDEAIPTKGEVEKRLSTKNLGSDHASSDSKGADKWINVRIDAQRQRAAGNIAILALDSEQEPGSKKSNSTLKTDSDMKSREEKKLKSNNECNLLLTESKTPVERSNTKQYKYKNSFNDLPKLLKSKDIALHDKFVLLFATLLLKSERFNDSFDVCNIYGRKCLHESELTRANLYKLLALTTLEKGNEGSANKALKHCEKAIKKFKNIKCLEGKASCLFIKILTLQLVKYENNSEGSEDGESSDSNENRKFSKIMKLISEVEKILPNIKSPFDEDQISQLMDVLYKSEKEKTPYDITSIQNLQDFLQTPTLSYLFQEEDKKFEKVVKKVKPVPELSKLEEKIDSLVNNQGAQFNTVLENLNKALERLDKVEDIIIKENKSTISSGTTFKVEHDTKCLTEAMEIKDNIKNQDKYHANVEEGKLVRTFEHPMKKANSGPYKKPNLKKDERKIDSTSENYSSLNDKSSRNPIKGLTSDKGKMFMANKKFGTEEQKSATTWRDTENTLTTNANFKIHKSMTKPLEKRTKRVLRVSCEHSPSDPWPQNFDSHRASSLRRNQRRNSQEKQPTFSSISGHSSNYNSLRKGGTQRIDFYQLGSPAERVQSIRSGYYSRPSFSYTQNYDSKYESKYTCPTFMNYNRNGLSRYYGP